MNEIRISQALKQRIESACGNSVNAEVAWHFTVMNYSSRNRRRMPYSLIRKKSDQNGASQAACCSVEIILSPRPFNRMKAWFGLKLRQFYQETSAILEDRLPLGITWSISYLVEDSPRRTLQPVAGSDVNIRRESRMLSEAHLNLILDVVENVLKPDGTTWRASLVKAIGDIPLPTEASWNAISWEDLQDMRLHIESLAKRVAALEGGKPDPGQGPF